MPEHVDTLEAHLFDDHIQEVDSVGARFAQRETNGGVHDFKRNTGKTGAATDVDHAGRPLGHVRIDERTVGIMAFHHRFKGIEAR